MGYIELFLANLFASIMGFGGTASSMHGATTIGGTYTSSLGSNTINEADDTLLLTTGTGVVSLGTSVVDAADAAINQYQRQVSIIQTTNAYIESLPEEELDELIASLSFDEPQNLEEEVKTLTKRL